MENPFWLSYEGSEGYTRKRLNGQTVCTFASMKACTPAQFHICKCEGVHTCRIDLFSILQGSA